MTAAEAVEAELRERRSELARLEAAQTALSNGRGPAARRERQRVRRRRPNEQERRYVLAFFVKRPGIWYSRSDMVHLMDKEEGLVEDSGKRKLQRNMLERATLALAEAGRLESKDSSGVPLFRAKPLSSESGDSLLGRLEG